MVEHVEMLIKVCVCKYRGKPCSSAILRPSAVKGGCLSSLYLLRFTEQACSLLLGEYQHGKFYYSILLRMHACMHEPANLNIDLISVPCSHIYT